MLLSLNTSLFASLSNSERTCPLLLILTLKYLFSTRYSALFSLMTALSLTSTGSNKENPTDGTLTLTNLPSASMYSSLSHDSELNTNVLSPLPPTNFCIASLATLLALFITSSNS
uniref:SSO3005-like protein n=1 Tax=Saccharolobus solfataricus (strain 98/2) TaxID=555311 RepID=G8GCS5_SACS9|nr:SSO3005-like protein [Saccharolobus solfataricus 98/2]